MPLVRSFLLVADPRKTLKSSSKLILKQRLATPTKRRLNLSRMRWRTMSLWIRPLRLYFAAHLSLFFSVEVGRRFANAVENTRRPYVEWRPKVCATDLESSAPL